MSKDEAVAIVRNYLDAHHHPEFDQRHLSFFNVASELVNEQVASIPFGGWRTTRTYRKAIQQQTIGFEDVHAIKAKNVVSGIGPRWIIFLYDDKDTTMQLMERRHLKHIDYTEIYSALLTLCPNVQ